jgi:predicted glycosyltransferase
VQAGEFRRLPNCIVPSQAIDSRSLIYQADLVLGAGGTMTREAALMGVPTFSLFAGRPAAVDDWLEERGMLQRLEHAAQIDELAPRESEPRTLADLRREAQPIMAAFIDALD